MNKKTMLLVSFVGVLSLFVVSSCTFSGGIASSQASSSASSGSGSSTSETGGSSSGASSSGSSSSTDSSASSTSSSSSASSSSNSSIPSTESGVLTLGSANGFSSFDAANVASEQVSVALNASKNVTLNYGAAYKNASGCETLTRNSYLYNAEAIPGISSVVFSFPSDDHDNGVTLYFSYEQAISGEPTTGSFFVYPDNPSVAFSDALPSYFFIVGTSTTTEVSSIAITYSGVAGTAPSTAGYKEVSRTDSTWTSETIAKFNDFDDYDTLKQSGTSKMLVIPVHIKNSLLSDAKRTSLLTDIQDGFFGDSTDTAWESLHSYYYKSSYGQLDITGQVTPWFNLGATASQILAYKGSSSSYDPTWTILENAIANFSTFAPGINLSDYDTDGNGRIDHIAMVYDVNDYDNADGTVVTSDDDTFWAYRFWDFDKENSGTHASPIGYSYFWCSYDFLSEGSSIAGIGDGIDAHTLIHENGHGLGLDDYYSYDSGTKDARAPAGGALMQDYNIGDQDAYSKMILGWTTPYVVDGTSDQVTISLRPFEQNGDCILLRDPTSWNGTAFDEYLVIELYTPTLLNKQDTTAYTSGLACYPSAGLEVFHVDSRLFDESTKKYVSGLSSCTEGYAVMTSNTKSYNTSDGLADRENCLLEMVQATTTNHANYLCSANYEGYLGKQSNLFGAGSSFSSSAYKQFLSKSTSGAYNGLLNDGTALGYGFSVSSLSASGATVVITAE